MDFGALDYSNDRGKFRQRGVAGAAAHSLTTQYPPKVQVNPPKHTNSLTSTPWLFVFLQVAATIEDL